MASRTICYGLGVISCLCMKDALPNRCSAVFLGNPSTSCVRSQLTHDYACIWQPSHVLDHHCSLCVLAHLAMLVCTNAQLIMGIVLQAYHALADFLIKQGTMSASKHIITHPPQQLEETLLRPIKKLREMVQGAALAEQAQSLTSFCPSIEDQVCTAYEIAREWEPPMPACMLDFYGR